MTPLLLSILLFLLGLVILVVGSNLFVDTALRLAKRFRVPEIIIGATMVSFGTTLPEVMFSSTAAFHGPVDMALGNALGSVICNAAFVAGIMQTIRPSPLDRRSLASGTINFFIFLTIYFILAMAFGGIPRLCGILMVILCVVYTIRTLKGAGADISAEPAKGSTLADICLLILEGCFLYAGAHLLVTYGPVIARYIGVPERVISLTLVALGTSLPELMTAINALVKGHGALSIGNIVGANILNLLLVGGLASAITPIVFPSTILSIELPLIAFTMGVLCIPAIIRGKMMRWQGLVLIGTYIAYLLYLF